MHILHGCAFFFHLAGHGCHLASSLSFSLSHAFLLLSGWLALRSPLSASFRLIAFLPREVQSFKRATNSRNSVSFRPKERSIGVAKTYCIIAGFVNFSISKLLCIFVSRIGLRIETPDCRNCLNVTGSHTRPMKYTGIRNRICSV